MAATVLVFFVVLQVSLSFTDHCPAEETCNGSSSLPAAASLATPTEKLIRAISKKVQRNVVDSSEGLYVSIKTTLKYHSIRLPHILFTWLQNVFPSQVHLVTDREASEDDVWLKSVSNYGFSVLYADCPTGKGRDDLCCKSGAEFDYYYKENKKNRWYCHFDDDVYVNIPVLMASLSRYDPFQDHVYIGRWPLAKEVLPVPELLFQDTFPVHERVEFRYGTGATYCLSAVLMTEVEQYLRGPHFTTNCKKLRLPEDMLVGCVIVAVLGYNLTNMASLNSNLNMMHFPQKELKQQSTVSYGTFTRLKDGERVAIPNKLNIPNSKFQEEEDPTRFFSYHCWLYPDTGWCQDLEEKEHHRTPL